MEMYKKFNRRLSKIYIFMFAACQTWSPTKIY